MHARLLTLVVLPLLMLAPLACDGPRGATGDPGPTGDPGGDGTPCYEGLSDQNGDGVVDVLDCRGSDGDDGQDGKDGDDGQDGVACWDLNADGVADLSSEDTNGDGSVDVLDCAGDDGRDGQDYASPTYVGWGACQACHTEQYDEVVRSGHPYKLRVIDTARPDDIQDGLAMTEAPANGNAPVDPPEGYTWDDIAYVIGGWGWKVRFIDRQGYIITCPKGDVDSDGDGFCDGECGGTGLTSCGSTGSDFAGQWNIDADDWVTYNRGAYNKKYSCGPCHTTGYDPEGETLDASGAIMHGIVGAWSEPGVRCEACHGPGSRHIGDPRHEPMRVDRDSELCGRCHVRGEPNEIPAAGGFVKHHEQWNEMFASKKHSMRCIDCHDPHQSARFADDTHNPTRGFRTQCETCHFREAAQQNNLARNGDSSMKLLLDCVDCHMPYAAKSAASLSTYVGDVRSHLFAINTDVGAPQFNGDGSLAMPYLALKTVCRACHKDPGTNEGGGHPNPVGLAAAARDDATLELSAAGYHD